MTKRELVLQVASKLGKTQNEVADIIQSMFDTITQSLVDGNRLEIRNFGVFEVKERDSRVGRNPRTGEEVSIPQKRVASFKPGKVLKKCVHDQAGSPSVRFKDEEKESSTSNGTSDAQSSPTNEPSDSNQNQQSSF